MYREYHDKLESGNDCKINKFPCGNIQRGTFQVDALLPLLFMIEMMALNRIIRKYTGGYTFHQSPEIVDDIKK